MATLLIFLQLAIVLTMIFIGAKVGGIGFDRTGTYYARQGESRDSRGGQSGLLQGHWQRHHREICCLDSHKQA